jgi:hypothetical protein
MPTEDEINKYGAGLSWLDQIKLFQEWAPLIGFAQRFVNEPDNYRKSLVVTEAVEWVAHKTNTGFDDQVAKLVGDILRTREGEALVRFCLLKAEEVR